MRLIFRLEALKEQTYDNNYNHYLQSFFYNLIKNTEFSDLHDFKGTSSPENANTPFCFSNIFLYGGMKEGEIRNIIISSPNEKFIFLLHDKMKRINTLIHMGGMEFHVISSKIFRVNISYPLTTASVTPIIVRIPSVQK
jgi:CRISPR/Cas system endoribonuclease Cas6 (RAMP superfamily)